MTEHVIGIDPGLDGVGVAWLSRTAGTIVVREVTTIRTKAAQSMGQRLRTIHTQLDALLDEWGAKIGVDGVITIAIEVPDNPGRSDHAKKQGGENVVARSMMKFWQSLGVIRATAAGGHANAVVDIPPGGAKKEYRQELFGRWTVAGTNPDERDAIVIACVHLFSSASVADLALATARPR